MRCWASTAEKNGRGVLPMLTVDTPRPARRPELVIKPLGDGGRYVVKDPVRGAYFHLGEEERFLLLQLDGYQDAEAIAAAFATRFGQPLAEEDLDEFVTMAKAQGLLQTPN